MTQSLRLKFLAGMLLASASLFAQKKQFTIAEATNGMATTLAPKSIKSPSWQPGADILWQTGKRNNADVWIGTGLMKDEKTELTIEQGKYPEKVNAIPAIKWFD